MTWSDDIFLLNEARGKETQQIDTSDHVFNTPSSTQALEVNNCQTKKWKMKHDNTIPRTLILCRLAYQGLIFFLFVYQFVCFCQNNWRLFNPTVFKSNWTKQKLQWELYSFFVFF